MKFFTFLIFTLAALTSALAAPIEFFLGDKQLKKLSLEEMKKISQVKDLKLRYHFSESFTKNYRGVALPPLLRAIYKKALADETYSEVVFEATDGYRAYSPLDILLKETSYLAFRDLDRKSGWEPVGFKKVSPAPYILVWEKEGQTTANAYPWPWSVSKIHLIALKDRYPKVYPKGKAPTSAEYKGYKVFRSQCFRCHAIDRQGGKIGPDLAAPQNILDYRDETYLRQFIRNPQKFRYSKMSGHDFLSKKEMDHLIAYLRSR